MATEPASGQRPSHPPATLAEPRPPTGGGAAAGVPILVSLRSSEMTYPPQQPEQTGSWQDPSSWPPPQQHGAEQPYGAAQTSPGYAVPPGSPAAYPPAYPGYGHGYGPPPAMPNNSLAIASMVLSLVGLGCGITAPIGAILGHIARRQIRERGQAGAGMALTGIIVGWIVTGLYLAYIAVVVVIVVFAAKNGTPPPTPFPS
jgi:hypothetical protein